MKILIPTDLGSCSDNAVRYAIRFAGRTGAALEFFHSAHEGTEEEVLRQLKNNIALQLDETKIVLPSVSYKVKKGRSFLEDLFGELEIAHADLVIMGTHGVSDLFHKSKASGAIASSPVPVLCVPCHGDFHIPTDLTYFTDLMHAESEMAMIRKFAKVLNAGVQMVHFDYGWAKSEEEIKMLDRLKKEHGLLDKKVSIEVPLLDHINEHMKSSASLVCLFHDRKSLFERFLTGNAAEEAPLKMGMPVLSFQRK